MAFKLKPWSGYRAAMGKSPLEYEKDPKEFANRLKEQHDDQSKEGARKRGETCAKCDKLKGNCTCPEGPQEGPVTKKSPVKAGQTAGQIVRRERHTV
tara:strand:+ start:1537 stop:1827 length:291 start_codon:yes stop_codon:yes gene_type:complete